jgi:transcriptional regulator with XRE-family HTH domain
LPRRQDPAHPDAELIAAVTTPVAPAPVAAAPVASDPGLGDTIRRLRLDKGLPLRAVAERASVSESFLSQVERGIADPSIASLRRIADALGERVASFFTETTVSGSLVRVRDRRRMVHPARAWEDAILTPSTARRLQIGQFSLAPGRGSGEELYSHAGDEECVIGQTGQLHVQVDTQLYVLSPGDALLLDPSVPHGMWASDEAASGMWVVTPGLY